MTDVSAIAPTTFRAPRLPKLPLPHLGLGASFGALIKAYGQALDLAYVAPYPRWPGHTASSRGRRRSRSELVTED